MKLKAYRHRRRFLINYGRGDKCADEITGHESNSPRQNMSKMQTPRAIALRYFEAAFAILLFWSACRVLGNWYDVKIVPGEQDIYLYLALTILLTALLSTRLFRLVLKIKAIRFIGAYPSVSVVSVLIVAGAAYCMSSVRSNHQAAFIALEIFGAAIMARALWSWIRKLLIPCEMAVKNQPMGDRWPAEMQWILDEKPIEAVKEDRFGYKSMVYRLASMVEQNTCQSFGLTGPHGSGKTSVLKMVEEELRKRGNKHWFVFVGGWGRTDENVSASVLEAIVDRLHEEGVEALSLLTWPADYMREILGDSSFLKRTIRCCIQEQQNSVAVVQRLDPVLDAIAKRVVVVVEDVDRKTSGDDMDTLCHLLDDFRQTRNVSFFFLKSEETKTGIDFHRLCEHTEMMPRIDPDTLAELLDQTMCAAKTVASEKILLHVERLDIKRLVAHRHVGGNTLVGNVVWPALCTLAHTPRSLKHALRRTMRIWQNLAGEVDLLELLLWALLREGCPEGYDYLRNNIQELRQMPSDIGGDKKNVEPLKRVCEQITSLGLPPAREQSLKVVLTLFGLNVSIFNDESFFLGIASDSTYGGKNLPEASQSISIRGGTDYFARLEAGILGDQEISDQLVLRELKRYVQDRIGVLPARAAEFKLWAEKIVQFEGVLPTGRLVDLIEDHVVALGKMHGGKAHDESPGFMELRQLWRARGDAYEPIRNRVPTIICHSLDYSLELACSIYAWYVDSRNPGLEHLIREKWVEDLRGRLEQREGYLSDVMNAECPWALFHTTRYQGKYPVYNTPQDWQWLVPHLIAAITAHARGAASNVAHLFIRDMRGARAGEGAWFELDSEYFEGMCPAAEDRAALARGLLQYAESRSENDPTAVMIAYVKKGLSQYC